LSKSDGGDLKGQFINIMDDDLNTAGGLGLIFDKVRDINRSLDSSSQGEDIKPRLIKERGDLLECGKALGLLEEEPSRFFQGITKTPSEVDTEELERLIQERDKARRARDWARADAIREELSGKGIILEDGPRGTKWRFNIDASI
ncbi:MAG: cysteine--tRNA ligase, partial [Deltaproteobacteria bacterium]